MYIFSSVYTDTEGFHQVSIAMQTFPEYYYEYYYVPAPAPEYEVVILIQPTVAYQNAVAAASAAGIELVRSGVQAQPDFPAAAPVLTSFQRSVLILACSAPVTF